MDLWCLEVKPTKIYTARLDTKLHMKKAVLHYKNKFPVEVKLKFRNQIHTLAILSYKDGVVNQELDVVFNEGDVFSVALSGGVVGVTLWGEVTDRKIRHGFEVENYYLNCMRRQTNKDGFLQMRENLREALNSTEENRYDRFLKFKEINKEGFVENPKKAWSDRLSILESENNEFTFPVHDEKKDGKYFGKPRFGLNNFPYYVVHKKGKGFKDSEESDTGLESRDLFDSRTKRDINLTNLGLKEHEIIDNPSIWRIKADFRMKDVLVGQGAPALKGNCAMLHYRVLVDSKEVYTTHNEEPLEVRVKGKKIKPGVFKALSVGISGMRYKGRRLIQIGDIQQKKMLQGAPFYNGEIRPKMMIEVTLTGLLEF